MAFGSVEIHGKGPDNLGRRPRAKDNGRPDLSMGCGELGKLHSIVYLSGR